ncbi:MAG: DUF459 domain-containing protein, partial [Pseudaminobacter sp.]|nr:DUF459 domain-containing protein [Pseudaminobacter sp.]
DVPAARPKKRVRNKTRSGKTRSAPARQQAEPEIKAAEKLPDAKTVLVVGDFLGGGLADGLTVVFADNPRVRIADRTNGSSGFVRDDHFNWPVEIGKIIEEEKPAAIVVMLGSNDRQAMRVGQEREAPLTDKWTSEYARRTIEFGASIAGHKTPFIWVGLPAFKSTKMTSDMLAFNDLYRVAAVSAGAEFIDIWEGFVDEHGAFVATGPDINGQPVRLRGDDGINMSKAGKRKLAFYAEKPLNKILGEAGEPDVDAPALALIPPVSPGAPAAAPLNRTAPVFLNDPALDGGSELLGLQVQPEPDVKQPAKADSGAGFAPEAEPGRADNFSWPRKPLAPVAVSTPAPSETSAIR